MPIDKTINQPDGADSLGPKPPTNPVEFARWVQRPRVNPKKPKVRPDDSALLPEPLEKPEVNRSIGTDKPKCPKRKNPNNTRHQGIFGQTMALNRFLWPREVASSRSFSGSTTMTQQSS